jgi:hypothetical protein
VILLSINVVMAFIILAYAIDSLTAMCPRTRHIIRAAHVLLAVGAFGIPLSVALGDLSTPSVAETLLHTGFASILAATRRRRTRPIDIPTLHEERHDPRAITDRRGPDQTLRAMSAGRIP